MLLCLLLAGVELPLSVAVADLCVDPNTYGTGLAGLAGFWPVWQVFDWIGVGSLCQGRPPPLLNIRYQHLCSRFVAQQLADDVATFYVVCNPNAGMRLLAGLVLQRTAACLLA